MSPRFGNIFALCVLGALFGMIGALWMTARAVFYAFAVLCGLGMLAIYTIAVIEARAAYYYAVGSASEKIAHLDPQQFQALGLTFPRVRARWPAGEVALYFDDTNATIEHFRAFMGGASQDQIYPERNCNAGLPRWAWDEIRACLEGRGYVIPDSYAGNRSWRWATPQTYANLRAYFWRYLERAIPEWD